MTSARAGDVPTISRFRDEEGIFHLYQGVGRSVVPWLAAEGRLAYSPELPPERDSLFQYGWVLPQVCRAGLRRHAYFGAMRRETAHDVFAFWQDARRGPVERCAYHEGTLTGRRVEAPIAVYRHNGLTW